MLSPSLLSGLDKGANTIELTNLVPFDIAVPGNHEFDFGPDNFLDKVKMSKYPWAAINVTHADGSPIDGLGGTMVKEIAGLKVALVPVAQDTTPEVSSPGDWKFGDTVQSAIDGAKAARAAGADLVIGVIQGDHAYDRAIMASHAFDVIMSGDDHDYMTGYDGITAYVETSTEAKYLAPLDLTVDDHREGRQALDLLGAVLPLHRHQDRDAGPRDAEARRRFQGEARREPQRRDRHDGRPARLAPQHRAQRGIGDRRPDRRRHARRQRRRRCDHQWRRHPRRQAIRRRDGADAPRHPDRAAVRQRHRA